MPKDDYYYKCPKCKKKIDYGVKKCPNCKAVIDWSDEENTKEVKVNTRLIIGIILIIFDFIMVLSETISCKNSYIPNKNCSFIRYEYGLFYVIGRFLFAIIGVILIYRWWKHPKYKEITIEENINEIDEDLEDIYEDEEYDEDLDD